MTWLAQGLTNFKDNLRDLPHPMRMVVSWSVVLLVLVCVFTVIGSLVANVWELHRPATAAALEQAKIEFEIEKLRVARIYAVRTEELRQGADAEAYRLKLGLSPERSSADESLRPLPELATLVTEHLASILALMLAVTLLPTFSRTGEHERLVLNIAAAIVLAGAYALGASLISPTVASLKVDVLSMTVSSSSVAVFLMLFGAALAAFTIHTKRAIARDIKKPPAPRSAGGKGEATAAHRPGEN
jgi:hypothetical protein